MAFVSVFPHRKAAAREIKAIDPAGANRKQAVPDWAKYSALAGALDVDLDFLITKREADIAALKTQLANVESLIVRVQHALLTRG